MIWRKTVIICRNSIKHSILEMQTECFLWERELNFCASLTLIMLENFHNFFFGVGITKVSKQKNLHFHFRTHCYLCV
jgi:hypothetical protein